MSPMVSCLLLVLATVVHFGVADPWSDVLFPWSDDFDVDLSSAENANGGGVRIPYEMEMEKRRKRQPGCDPSCRGSRMSGCCWIIENVYTS